jgi:hypothetical protein
MLDTDEVFDIFIRELFTFYDKTTMIYLIWPLLNIFLVYFKFFESHCGALKSKFHTFSYKNWILLVFKKAKESDDLDGEGNWVRFCTLLRGGN